MKIKTRKAYGIHKETKEVMDFGDTVKNALFHHMLVKDYENALVKENPEFDITFKIESK